MGIKRGNIWFDFEPVIFAVSSVGSSGSTFDVFSVSSLIIANTNKWIYVYQHASSYASSSAIWYCTKSGNTMSWYNTIDAEHQANYAERTYYWLVIG